MKFVKDPLPDFKPAEARCGQGEATWIVVLVLLLGIASSITAASVLGSLQAPAEVTYAVLFVAAYSALGLVALLVTAIVLAVAACCLPRVAAQPCAEERDPKYPNPEASSC